MNYELYCNPNKRQLDICKHAWRVWRSLSATLYVAVVEQFLVGERVASWMRQSGEALRDCLRSSDTAPVRPSDVMGNTVECPKR